MNPIVRGTMPLIDSPRRFGLWRYTVGHAQLLLRSNPTDEDRTRIEVLFKGVMAIRIPTDLHGLRVREATDPEEVARLALDSGINTQEGNRYYVIESRDSTGWIVALAAVANEDNLSYNDPSGLFVPQD